jgi:hypothetical protein
VTLDPNVSEWLNLTFRWTHVFAGILWVGQTYFFTWLDGRFADDEGQVWMVHSGGFYVVEKQKVPSLMPRTLHWFRWEAAFTWITGIVLLTLVYYMGGVMTDDSVSAISTGAAIGMGRLRFARPVAARQIGDGVRSRLLFARCRGDLRIDPRAQRTRSVHAHRRDVRHDHDSERLDAHPSRTAKNGCGPESRPAAGRRAYGPREAALEAQYLHGRARGFPDDQQSLPWGNLRQSLQLGSSAPSGAGRLGRRKTRPPGVSDSPASD